MSRPATHAAPVELESSTDSVVPLCELLPSVAPVLCVSLVGAPSSDEDDAADEEDEEEEDDDADVSLDVADSSGSKHAAAEHHSHASVQV